MSAAEIIRWAERMHGDDAVNLIVVGENEDERTAAIDRALTLAPPAEYVRLLYGEVAAATARDCRLLLANLGSDRWSEARVLLTQSVPLLVIEDFGAGIADYYEIYGLKNVFDHRRQQKSPIIVLPRYSHDELFHVWNVDAVETVLAEQALWRLFLGAIVIAT